MKRLQALNQWAERASDLMLGPRPQRTGCNAVQWSLSLRVSACYYRHCETFLASAYGSSCVEQKHPARL